jgi:hypothetical protein
MKRLSKVVALPEKLSDIAEPGKVRSYSRDLHDSLEFTLKDIIRRANGALPRDGTEEMEDDLTLANNTPTVDEHAASKKYVDDAIVAVPPGGLASGTRVFFDQDAAPTDWTRDTGINDRVIRIVSGARADGGSWTVGGLTNSGGSVGNTSLSVAQLASHRHHTNIFTTGLSGAYGVRAVSPVGPIYTAYVGSGSTHGHSFTPPTIASDASWRPLHRDVIVASKD